MNSIIVDKEEIIVNHQNEPTLPLLAPTKKTVRDLQGLITKIKIKEDINDPILPEFDQ